MLLLALLGLTLDAPGVVGVLLGILAVQMMLGHAGPVFPGRVADRRFRTHGLARTLGRAAPVLRYIEGFIHPRWPTPFEATKRGIGPDSVEQHAPAPAIMLIAGLSRSGRAHALRRPPRVPALLLAIAGGALWQAMSEIGWVRGVL